MCENKRKSPHPFDKAFTLTARSRTPSGYLRNGSMTGGRWLPLRFPATKRSLVRSGGNVLERTRSGEEHEWGSVTVWDPPERLEFTWRLFTDEREPGGERGNDESVTVDFRVEADGTRVTLTHRGWHWAGVATCVSRFARFVSEQMLAAV